MPFFEDMMPFLDFWGVREKTGVFTDSVTQMFMNSMTNNDCGGDHHSDIPNCRDESAALILKFAAMAAILLAGVCGIAIPLVGKHRNFLKSDSNLFVAAKSFAGGVILATGFVHMLPDASNALTNPCLPKNPWSKFPFSGFVAMMASLGTLLVEFIGTQYYERKQGKPSEIVQVDDESLEFMSESGRGVDHVESKNQNGKVFGEEEGGGMHIVGMHAHVAHHRHSHSQEHGACAGALTSHSHGGHSHTHGLIEEENEEQEGSKRHVVVSQVLELGIVSHSVIIGLSLGVSQSPCTIRPLVGALSFHQFFEGFALGGCISQAQFKTAHATVMACFFAITTPLGIAVGTGISSIYNPNSPRALIIEGILDSISAGILVYMALVDLVAADFLSKRMSCNLRLQVASYIALFFGAALMSSLALWA